MKHRNEEAVWGMRRKREQKTGHGRRTGHLPALANTVVLHLDNALRHMTNYLGEKKGS